MTYYANDGFFERLHTDGKGYVLSSETELVQLRSARPVLVSLAFNQGLYFPQTWAGMLEIYRDAYGVEPEELSRIRGGALMPETYRHIWEARDYASWVTLAKEYNFSSVVTRRGLFLDLPLAGEGRELLHYSLNAGARAHIVTPDRHSSQDIGRVFDRSISLQSQWQSDRYPGVIEVSYDTPFEIKGYSLTVGETIAGRPKDWMVEGKRATGTWRLLDHRVGWEFGPQRTRYFAVPPASIDRLRITFTRGHSGSLRLFELQIEGDCITRDVSFSSCPVEP